MKLREFNTENTVVSRNTTPSLHINTKTGLFTINKGASEILGLSDKDQVAFHQNEEVPDEWYIEKVKEKGFAIRDSESKNSSNSLLFNNTTLARKLFESVGYHAGGGSS